MYIQKPTIQNLYMPSFCKGCWIFDNTGNKIIDLSQYQNHGTNNGSQNKGNRNVFNGTSDFVSLPNAKSLDITSAPLAVFATIKTPNTLQAGYIFSKNLDASANMQYGYFVYGDGRCFVNLEGTTRKDTATGVLTTNKWYDLGFLWDGANVNVYINYSASGAAGTYSGSLTSRANVTIGKRMDDVFFKGGINNVAVYTTKEINSIFRHRKILNQNIL